MKKYGKRKRPVVPSFGIYYDRASDVEVRMSEGKRQESTTFTISAFYGRHIAEPVHAIPVRPDDSIEEIASMLLGDTTIDQPIGEAGKRFSQIGSARVLPRTMFNIEEGTSQVPQLLFGRGNAYLCKAHELMDAKSFESEPKGTPLPLLRCPRHARNNATPPLRQKSSRRCVHPGDGRQKNEVKSPRFSSSHIESDSARYRASSYGSTPFEYVPSMTSGRAKTNNSKFVAMAATLGTPDDSDASLPVVAAKNRRFRGNNVLTKIKNAIGGRLYGSGKKQRHSAVANGHLLDDTIDGLSIHDEDDTGVSAVDMTNETKDRLFGDDPVSDVPPGPFLVRPTKFACRLKLGEKPPDPLRDHTPSKLPRNRGLNNILPQSSTHKEMDSAIDVDFDALLSSSPLGQSTPQIHLEPSFDDASKKPKNIPPGTYSVFDIGTKNERNFDSPGFHITASRQAPSVVILADNHSGRNFQIASTQRTKHPSPSKDELETPEEALRHYLPADEWDEEIAYERVANSVDDLRSSGALKRKGSFAGWEKGRDGDMKRRGFEANNSMATSASAANSGHLPKSFASKVRKVSMLAKPAGPPYILKPRSASGISAEVACKVIIGNSALDVDELQWDETAYDIGMRVA